MLQLMALGIPDVMNFDFMSKPSPGNVFHVLAQRAPRYSPAHRRSNFFGVFV